MKARIWLYGMMEGQKAARSGRPETGIQKNREGRMPENGLLFKSNDRQKRHWKSLKKWLPVSFVLILYRKTLKSILVYAFNLETCE